MHNNELVIRKVGTSLGILTAVGTGVLAGIESAIMWSKDKVAVGVSFGLSSCFINTLSYYYVVMHGFRTQEDRSRNYVDTIYSNLFLGLGICFGIVMAISNFNGMYVSYTVLGDKVNELGNTEVTIPDLLLSIFGWVFGFSSAASGALFNYTVGKQIWNSIRAERNPSNISQVEQSSFSSNGTDTFFQPSDSNKPLLTDDNRRINANEI